MIGRDGLLVGLFLVTSQRMPPRYAHPHHPAFSPPPRLSAVASASVSLRRTRAIVVSWGISGEGGAKEKKEGARVSRRPRPSQSPARPERGKLRPAGRKNANQRTKPPQSRIGAAGRRGRSRMLCFVSSFLHSTYVDHGNKIQAVRGCTTIRNFIM